MSATCAACAAAVAGVDDRFCRTCGAALALGADLGPRADPAPDPGQVASTVEAVRRDAPTRWWLAAVAVLAVLAAGWAATRSGGGGGATVDREQAALDDGTVGGSPASSDAPSLTEPSLAEPDASGPGASEPPRTVRVEEEGTGPVLGRPVGWSLLMGSAYDLGASLHRLDLDTGQLLRYKEVDGGPVLLIGDRLVLLSSRPELGTGSIRTVAVADPGGDPVSLDGPGAVTPEAVVAADPATGGGLWVYQTNSSTARWTRFDGSTGEMLDEVAVGSAASGRPVPGSGPELATSGSSGVFRWATGDGYRLLAPGRPMAAVGGDVLVQSCSSPLDCSLTWIDGSSGEPVDRPVPPDDERVYWYGLVPGSDRYLSGQRWTDGPPFIEGVIVDLTTGRLLELDRPRQGIASSPDGRYLVAIDYFGPAEQVVVYDAETGAVDPLELPPTFTYGGGQMLFVPNG